MKDSSDLRKRFWVPFTFNHEKKEKSFYAIGKESKSKDDLLKELRTGDIENYECDMNLLMNSAQIILWILARENGWDSYQKLLDKAKSLLSMEFWKECGEEKVRISKDLSKYPDNVRKRLLLPYWSHIFERGSEFAHKTLMFLAGLSPETAENVQLEADPSSNVCLYKIGSQIIGSSDTPGKRGRW